MTQDNDDLKDSVVFPGPVTDDLCGAETAWLIEETWSGYVHYVHRDFDCVKWATECRNDDWRRRFGLRARMRVPIVTKNIEEARRFETKDAADLWLALQPRWMSTGDQYQVREHMWVDMPPWLPTKAQRVALIAQQLADMGLRPGAAADFEQAMCDKGFWRKDMPDSAPAPAHPSPPQVMPPIRDDP